jgi:acetolactate synthase I/II/III large subunit
LHHEQAAAMAADGISRNGMGKQFQLSCAVATSGPGATNLITGIAGAFYDSIPILFITGQVASFRLKPHKDLRQFGFQETSIVDMVKTITKFSHQVKDLEEIDSIFTLASKIALSDRPGPVLIDIPDDFQRSDFEHKKYVPTVLTPNKKLSLPLKSDSIDSLLSLLNSSERPVVVIGSGARYSRKLDRFIKLLELNKIPILTTWGGKELVSCKNSNLFGTFGTHGTRYGNLIIQNSDLVLSIGARLSTRETGSPMTWFARGAKLIVVDIDNFELDKFDSQNKILALKFNCDVDLFINNFLDLVSLPSSSLCNFQSWVDQCNIWKIDFSLANDYSLENLDYVNPFSFFSWVDLNFATDEKIVLDTGCAVAWACQILNLKEDQRLFHDFANTAMGWAIPASLGIAHDCDKSIPISVIVGDGSLMMNIQELANFANLERIVKVFVLNNSGYGMVRQTEDQWLGGNRSGTSFESGLFFPDFRLTAEANQMEYVLISNNSQMNSEMWQSIASSKNSVLIEIRIDENAKVVPQSLYGKPIEDMSPLLSREIFEKNMIIEPLLDD